ncbi:MAG: class I SAM-dependent methyltransferase [Acidobacteriota bacterium]|nr:class I SAM-dependent methyltransferase [Acidobacteriota bacterium]MDH3528498.1 class I SAM-dependent methyltransferase [Acidobacteriota bacterium]
MNTDFADVPIAKVKDYWNERPCNIRHSTAEVGTREYFDQVEARKYFVEPHIPGFAEFEKWRGKRVLEIGCGIGTDTINFARAGAQVTAVDLSAKSLELAKKRVEVFGFTDRVEFFEANAENLSEFVEPRQYDLIYSFGVIHHSPQPEKIIDQIKTNFAGPETVLKLMVYYRYSWKVLWILLTSGRGRFWRLDEMIAENSEAQTGCPVTYSYNRKSLRELVGTAFEIDNMFVDHIFPYRIPDYVKYRYVKVWYFRLLPDFLFRFFERRCGWHLCMTAKCTQD